MQINRDYISFCHWWVRINSPPPPALILCTHTYAFPCGCYACPCAGSAIDMPFSSQSSSHLMQWSVHQQCMQIQRLTHKYTHIHTSKEILLFLYTTKITDAKFRALHAQAKKKKTRSQMQITLTLTNADKQGKLCKRRAQIEKFGKYCKAQHTHTQTHVDTDIHQCMCNIFR